MTSASVKLTIPAREKDLGGFKIRRLLPYARQRMVGPFIFFDHIGPAEFAPDKGVDVRPHPHINLATVTYLFDGELHHRDSLGTDIRIQPGAVNWMTAGSGIAHSERSASDTRRNQHKLHGIQSWVALPDDAEECEPDFTHHPADTLPEFNVGDARIRLIAGHAYDQQAPVGVHSPLYYAHAELPLDGYMAMPATFPEHAIYIVSGRLAVDQTEYAEHQLLVVEAGSKLRAMSGCRLMLFGGEPVGKRHIWWNFVSSNPERIEQAKADWKGRKFATVPGEVELIPLPEDG